MDQFLTVYETAVEVYSKDVVIRYDGTSKDADDFAREDRGLCLQ
jgi:hypothetical protein